MIIDMDGNNIFNIKRHNDFWLSGSSSILMSCLKVVLVLESVLFEHLISDTSSSLKRGSWPPGGVSLIFPAWDYSNSTIRACSWEILSLKL